MSETLDMIAFGPFHLDTDRRRLERQGCAVALSSRAFDILVLLVAHRGRVVSKDEIMTQVWRGMIVEENNLAVQISALRRALANGAAGTPMIVTVPGHGYRFVGRLNRQGDDGLDEAARPDRSAAFAPARAGPDAPSEGLRGRDAAAAALVAPAANGLAPAALTPAVSAPSVSTTSMSAPGAPAPEICGATCGPPEAHGPVLLPTIAMPPPPAPAAPAQAAPPAGGWRVAGARSGMTMAVLGAGFAAVAAFLMLRAAPVPPVPEAPPPPRLSIAVLPFRDLSDQRCCDYLADAISDDLTTDLSLIPGSVVIARESSDVFRGKATPAGEIGRTLNVRYLLEGSLRAQDGAFSINAQLIEAATGAHVWAERFSVPRAGLSQAQNTIVQRLASALGVTLVAIEGAKSLHDRPLDPDAMDLFLRARSILDRSDSLDGMTRAQALLEQALRLAPDDVKALSELAWLLPRKVRNFVTPHFQADLAEARALVARAMALQPRDPAVLAAKAALQSFDGNCTEAELTFQAALEGQPDSVRALTGLTVCKFQLGQFADAVSSLTTLMRIDPEGPRERTRLYQIGFAQLMLGRAAEALPWLHRANAGTPEPAPGEEALGMTEWTRLSLIAAERLAGDRATADALAASARAIWAGRTTWTLESRSPRLYAALAGFRQFLGALEAAGMPRFADGTAGAATGACDTAAFQPTPHSVPGVTTIDTAALVQMMHGRHPLVADFGVGAGVPAGAVLSALDPSSAGDMAALRQGAAGAPIVTMGSGPLDPRGCQAATHLAGAGAPVFWYRGGEEAWAQAALPATDMR